MTSRLGTLFALAAIAFASGGAAGAQEAERWDRSCDGDRCTLTFPLVDAATERRVATFLAIVAKNEAESQLGVAVPLGAALEAGVRLIAGETVVNVTFQVCYPDGCRAMRRAGTATLDAITMSDQLDIRFFPFGNERPISIVMPTAGLTQAMDEARSELTE